MTEVDSNDQKVKTDVIEEQMEYSHIFMEDLMTIATLSRDPAKAKEFFEAKQDVLYHWARRAGTDDEK